MCSLFSAVLTNDLKTIRETESEELISFRCKSYNRTLLYHVKSASMVKLLVKKGLDPNARDAQGWSPLHLADTVSVTRALVEAGADVNAKSNAGYQAITQKRSLAAFLYLLDQGSDYYNSVLYVRNRGGIRSRAAQVLCIVLYT
jgi:ankyrin repeat protein